MRSFIHIDVPFFLRSSTVSPKTPFGAIYKHIVQEDSV
jgi:hypothetical protein